MELVKWIQRYPNCTISACARAWGISFSQLKAIAARDARASYDVGMIIERQTGGEVTMHEVCGPLPASKLTQPAPVKTASGVIVPTSTRGKPRTTTNPSRTAPAAAPAPAAPAPTPRRRNGRAQSATPGMVA